MYDYRDQIIDAYTINDERHYDLDTFNVKIGDDSEVLVWDPYPFNDLIIDRGCTVRIEPIPYIQYITVNFYDPGNGGDGVATYNNATGAVDYSNIQRRLLLTEDVLVPDDTGFSIYEGIMGYNSGYIFPLDENGMVVGFKQTHNNLLIPMPLQDGGELAEDHIERFKIDLTKIESLEVDIDCDMLRFDYYANKYSDKIDLDHMVLHKSKDGALGDLSDVVVYTNNYGGRIIFNSSNRHLYSNTTHTIKHLCSIYGIRFNDNKFPICHMNNNTVTPLISISKELLRYCQCENDDYQYDVPVIVYVNNNFERKNYKLPLIPLSDLTKYQFAKTLKIRDMVATPFRYMPDELHNYFNIPSKTEYYEFPGMILQEKDGVPSTEIISLQMDGIITEDNSEKLRQIVIGNIENGSFFEPDYNAIDNRCLANVTHADIFTRCKIRSDMNWNNVKIDHPLDYHGLVNTNLDDAPPIPTNFFIMSASNTVNFSMNDIIMTNKNKKYFESGFVTLNNYEWDNLYLTEIFKGHFIFSEKCIPSDFMKLNTFSGVVRRSSRYNTRHFEFVTLSSHNDVDENVVWLDNYLHHLNSHSEQNGEMQYYDIFAASPFSKLPDSLFEFIDKDLDSLYEMFTRMDNLVSLPSQDDIIDILKQFHKLTNISEFAYRCIRLTHIPEIWLDETLSSRLTNTDSAFFECVGADNYYRCPVSYGGPSKIPSFTDKVSVSQSDKTYTLGETTELSLEPVTIDTADLYNRDVDMNQIFNPNEFIITLENVTSGIKIENIDKTLTFVDKKYSFQPAKIPLSDLLLDTPGVYEIKITLTWRDENISTNLRLILHEGVAG